MLGKPSIGVVTGGFADWGREALVYLCDTQHWRANRCRYVAKTDRMRSGVEIPGGITPLVTMQGIQAAADRIRNSVLVSPFERSEAFSQQTGNSIYLKLENHQMTGAFKERGALNKILLLTDEERRRGVIAASAGNHAQAVAYHAVKRGIRAQIVMPLTTPLVKASATRGYGAEVILFGANYDEACAEALRICGEQGLTFIHPFDDEAVIAGQGTLGIEMLAQAPDLDAVIIPVGGGGLDRGSGLRGERDEPQDQSVWSANVEAAFDEGGRGAEVGGDIARREDHCRRNCCSQRGRADAAARSQVRG